MLKFHDISRAGNVSIFLYWWNLVNFEKMLKFHDISRAGTVGTFLWKKLTSLKKAQISHACFWWWFQYVLQVWWNLVNFEKILKFHDISKGGTVGFFLWNKSTSLNGLKFHMHVSDDDSNKFCKFDEIWWTLKKCENLRIFLGHVHCQHFSVKKYYFSEYAQISHACFWW